MHTTHSNTQYKNESSSRQAGNITSNTTSKHGSCSHMCLCHQAV